MAGRVLFACGTDNDGYPTCQGDGTTCGPNDSCAGVEQQAGTEFVLIRRSPRDRLRYLAQKLEDGTDPKAVAFSLRQIADE